MMKSMVRYEEVASDPTAVWRIATAANHKTDMVQHQRGDFQKVMAGLQESMNRIEVLVQRLVSSQTRDLPDLVPPAELENEMTRRVDNLRQTNVRSTPEGNFNFPSTGFSVVATGWGLDPLPHPPLVSPTLNNWDQDQGSDLARQWPQNSRGYLNPPQFQYHANQWNPNPSNERVHNFYKSLAKGPKFNSPEFDGGESLVEAAVQKKEITIRSFTLGVCEYCGYKWVLGHKCKQNQQVNLMAGEGEVGAEIVRRALSYPLKLIAKNAGVNGSVITEKVHSSTVERVTYSFAAGDPVLLKEQDKNHSQVVRIWDPGTGSKNRKMRHEVKEGRKMLHMSKVWQQRLFKEPEKKQLPLAAISWKESRVCQRSVKRFVKDQEFIEATREPSITFMVATLDGVLGPGFQEIYVGNAVPVWYNMVEQVLIVDHVFSF